MPTLQGLDKNFNFLHTHVIFFKTIEQTAHDQKIHLQPKTKQPSGLTIYKEIKFLRKTDFQGKQNNKYMYVYTIVTAQCKPGGYNVQTMA